MEEEDRRQRFGQEEEAPRQQLLGREEEGPQQRHVGKEATARRTANAFASPRPLQLAATKALVAVIPHIIAVAVTITMHFTSIVNAYMRTCAIRAGQDLAHVLGQDVGKDTGEDLPTSRRVRHHQAAASAIVTPPPPHLPPSRCHRRAAAACPRRAVALSRPPSSRRCRRRTSVPPCRSRPTGLAAAAGHVGCVAVPTHCRLTSRRCGTAGSVRPDDRPAPQAVHRAAEGTSEV